MNVIVLIKKSFYCQDLPFFYDRGFFIPVNEIHHTGCHSHRCFFHIADFYKNVRFKQRLLDGLYPVAPFAPDFIEGTITLHALFLYKKIYFLLPPGAGINREPFLIYMVVHRCKASPSQSHLVFFDWPKKIQTKTLAYQRLNANIIVWLGLASE